MFCLFTLPLSRPVQAKIQMLTISSWIATIFLSFFLKSYWIYKIRICIYNVMVVQLLQYTIMQVAALNLSTVYWAEDNEMAKKTLLQTFQVNTRILLFIPTANIFPVMKTRFPCTQFIKGKFIAGNSVSVTIVPRNICPKLFRSKLLLGA